MIRPGLYLLLFILLFGGFAGGVFRYNWQIDPYRFQEQANTEADRFYKPDYHRYTRSLKPLQLGLRPVNRVFLGTSRMEYLAPDLTSFAREENGGFNLALTSGSTFEMNQLLNFAIRQKDLNEAWYGLDFYSFTNLSEERDSLIDTELLEGKKSARLEVIKKYLSFQGIEDSEACLLYNTTRGDSLGLDIQYQYNNQGSRTGAWRELTLSERGGGWIKEVMELSRKQYTGLYNRDSIQLSPANLTWYQQTVARAQEESMAFYPFVNPLSAGHFQDLLASSALDEYKSWLDSLAHSGGVFYFGGVNEWTLDTNLYWDSHHARKEMFPLLRERMLTKNKTIQPDLFGYWIDEENIDRLKQELDKLKILYDKQ